MSITNHSYIFAVFLQQFFAQLLDYEMAMPITPETNYNYKVFLFFCFVFVSVSWLGVWDEV